MLTISSGDCDEEECELILINAIIAIFEHVLTNIHITVTCFPDII